MQDTPDMPADMPADTPADTPGSDLAPTPEQDPSAGPEDAMPAPARELSPAMVAAELGVNERTVRRWIARGELAAQKAGAHYVVDAAELARYRATRPAPQMAAGEQPPSGQAAAPTGEPGAEPAEGDQLGHPSPPSAGAAIDLRPLAEVIERQGEEIRRLTEAATLWQVRALRAEDQLKQLGAGAVPDVPRDMDAADSPEIWTQGRRAVAEPAEPQGQPRPWWKFWG